MPTLSTLCTWKKKELAISLFQASWRKKKKQATFNFGFGEGELKGPR